MESRLADIGRIPLDLRIGVTGHRWIPTNDARISAVVRAALEDAIAHRADVPVHATAIGVTVVSALAEGADRLVAALGLELGARLEVVLPLPVAEFEKDFRDEASRAEFRDLLARAATVDVVETSWMRDHNYRTAGLTMADRIDVLVALYDGQPAQGTGGTAEIVEYAKSLLVPVVELRATHGEGGAEVQPPSEPLDLRNSPLTPAALRRLDDFNRVKLSAASQARVAQALAKEPDNAWLPYYERADLLAVYYQRRHKQAVRGLYLLSALAVAAMATQLIFFDERPEVGWVEFGILVVLLVGLVTARRRELLGKWTSTRYIAERMRSAMFLSKIGGTPSFALVPTGGGADEWGRVDWAGRAIREVWFRTAPGEAGRGDPNPDSLSETQWIDTEWVQPQINYHTGALAKYSRLQRAANVTAIVLFGISIVAAFVHSAHIGSKSWSETSEWVSIVVPAVGAAVSGYAAQREFGRQAMRSRHVLRDLTKLQLVLRAAQTPSEVRALVGQLDVLVHGDAAEWYIAANLHEPEIP